MQLLALGADWWAGRSLVIVNPALLVPRLVAAGGELHDLIEHRSHLRWEAPAEGPAALQKVVTVALDRRRVRLHGALDVLCAERIEDLSHGQLTFEPLPGLGGEVG